MKKNDNLALALLKKKGKRETKSKGAGTKAEEGEYSRWIC